MTKQRATEIGPFAGVAFVCLAYQSCENNHVCVASSLSRWSIISGPSDRMAHTVCVEHCGIWVRGTPLAGTASDGSHDKANKTQTSFQLGFFFSFSFFYTRVKMAIDEGHQVQC